MTREFVADSSVGVAWSVLAQANAKTDQLLEDIAHGARVIAPVLWPFEVANALLVLERRRRILAQERKSALHALIRLPVSLDDEGTRVAFSTISELANEHGLSIYDASYLELALRNRLPLASRDASLCAAAKKTGVPLLC